jgi:hypothetical protein
LAGPAQDIIDSALHPKLFAKIEEKWLLLRKSFPRQFYFITQLTTIVSEIESHSFRSASPGLRLTTNLSE